MRDANAECIRGCRYIYSEIVAKYVRHFYSSSCKHPSFGVAFVQRSRTHANVSSHQKRNRSVRVRIINTKIRTLTMALIFFPYAWRTNSPCHFIYLFFFVSSQAVFVHSICFGLSAISSTFFERVHKSTQTQKGSGKFLSVACNR